MKALPMQRQFQKLQVLIQRSYQGVEMGKIKYTVIQISEYTSLTDA